MENKYEIQTNWYVITGGPGSGKTTTINILNSRGYKTTIEHARHYIDTQRQEGRTVEEIRKNQEEFQMKVLQMQIDQESQLDPGQLIFLDRAIPDALAYYHFLNLPPNTKLLNSMYKFKYKKIFILDCLPLVNDYARREDTKAQKNIHNLLIDVYRSLSIPIVFVPVLSPNSRADFIINNL